MQLVTFSRCLVLLCLLLSCRLDAVSATTTSPRCKDLTVLVSATAIVQAFNLTGPHYDALVASIFATGAADLSAGTQNASGSHALKATYCEPSNGVKSKTLQLLAHGVTYDRFYWAWPQTPSKYSWVQYMTSRGYATFSFDRLGNGQSDHPDPLLVTQVLYQAQLYANLALLLKNGSISGVPKAFTKVVYVGHSFGSIIGNSVATQRPESIDGLLLTGYLNDYPYLAFTFPISANLVPSNVAIPPYGYNPASFGVVGADFYISNFNQTGREALYGHPDEYDVNVLTYDNSHRGILTAGEALTVNGGDKVAPSFTGPVRVIIGEYDIPFCNARSTNGDALTFSKCSLPSNAGTASAPYFPSSKSYSYWVVPNTGHSLNLQYAAQSVFEDAYNWFKSQGF